jgi:hypothetical protein
LKDDGDDADDANDAKLHTFGSLEKGGIPLLSKERILQLAGDYMDAAAMELEETGDVDFTTLERRLRENLATAGVPPESVAVEFARVMEALAAF